MEELTLSEIKKIELNILKFLKKYCEENHIRYFLSNGTLLGAVKYKGFIPWDDDIDVLMPRADYERFIKEFFTEDHMQLLCNERCNNYVFPYAKLSDMSTVIKGQTIISDYKYGVHIDIFPLDRWSDDVNYASKSACRIQAWGRKLGFSISHFCKGRTFFRTCVKSIFIACARMVGWKYYHKKLTNEIHCCMDKAGDTLCGCLVWPVYGEREIIPAEVFSDIVEVEFEGEKYPAPIGYDTYLRSLYGNYEEEPPIKRQKTHHTFKAYKL